MTSATQCSVLGFFLSLSAVLRYSQYNAYKLIYRPISQGNYGKESRVEVPYTRGFSIFKLRVAIENADIFEVFLKFLKKTFYFMKINCNIL